MTAVFIIMLVSSGLGSGLGLEFFQSWQLAPPTSAEPIISVVASGMALFSTTRLALHQRAADTGFNCKLFFINIGIFRLRGTLNFSVF